MNGKYVDIPSLKVVVAVGKANHYADPAKLSKYHDYKVLYDITAGQTGGANPGDNFCEETAAQGWWIMEDLVSFCCLEESNPVIYHLTIPHLKQSFPIWQRKNLGDSLIPSFQTKRFCWEMYTESLPLHKLQLINLFFSFFNPVRIHIIKSQ